MRSEKAFSQAREKIIVALDVPDARQARRHIRELRDHVGAFKIGLQLFTSSGASFVREAVKDGIKIFLDVKYHDIPNTVARASVEAARLGIWMFNIHASGGSEMMKRTVSEVKETCLAENLPVPLIIGVTVLTSSDQNTLSETGVSENVGTQVLNLAELTAKCGLDGVVASPAEARLIRQNIKNKEFLIVTPGIRPGNATKDDQKRVMTPLDAVNNGSDYLVIGRPVLRASDKIKAIQNLLKELET